MNRVHKVFLFFILISGDIIAQNLTTTLENKFDVGEKNLTILNDNELDVFFKKLDSLDRKLIDKVSIVHIGDSHLQAGFSSNETRKLLQLRFGNSGQGLVFPYQVAKTNSPPDSYSFSNSDWDSFKVSKSHSSKYETGIKGYSIVRKDTSAILKLSVNPKDSLDYSFDKVTVFHPYPASDFSYDISHHDNREVLEESVHKMTQFNYKVKRGDYLGKIAEEFNTTVSELKELNELQDNLIYENQILIVLKKESYSEPVNGLDFTSIVNSRIDFDYHSEFILDSLKEYMFIKNLTSSKTPSLQINGISLEKLNTPGVLYHMIGVNGAKFEDYYKSELFFKQLIHLKPDLIIVSLGTNEVSDNKSYIEDDIDMLINKLYQSTDRHFSILLTTPLDYKKKSVLAFNLSKQILNYINTHDLPCINFYDLFGGQGAMLQLQKLELAQSDGIHLTAKGYKLQGYLLASALLEAFINRNDD
jgi:LysM repeat protein/lysophospholipase L1-like esterase